MVVTPLGSTGTYVGSTPAAASRYKQESKNAEMRKMPRMGAIVDSHLVKAIRTDVEVNTHA